MYAVNIFSCLFNSNKYRRPASHGPIVARLQGKSGTLRSVHGGICLNGAQRCRTAHSQANNEPAHYPYARPGVNNRERAYSIFLDNFRARDYNRFNDYPPLCDAYYRRSKCRFGLYR